MPAPDSRRLDAMVANLSHRGVALPRNPNRARLAAASMHQEARTPGAMRAVLGDRPYSGVSENEDTLKAIDENTRLIRSMRQARRAKTATATNTGGGDVYAAIPRFYDPMEYWELSGIPWNMADEGHRHKLHKWLRLFYATHYLIPILIDIFTRFPLVGMEMDHPDPQLKKYYEELFLNELNYPDYLVEVGTERWLVGEAFSLGSFDEDLGIWEREELLNPEDIVIENFPLLGTRQIKLHPPDYLKKLAQTKAPAKQYKQLEMHFPEIIPFLLKNEDIPISEVLLRQVANTLTPWDDHGTPHILRGLRTLIHEEKLLASQDAIAERLYSPLILAKLGAVDIGDGQGPWMPTGDELDTVRDDLDIAFASDFRLMVYHFGLEIENVFGREQMPRLGDDFDRIERRLMMCLSGDTLVHTQEGLIPARDLSGEVKVLSKDGVYRTSNWASYGYQPLYEITLANGDTLEATAEHEWIITQHNGKHRRVKTLDLVGEKIPIEYARDDYQYDTDEWHEGVRHGLVYGDGWLYLDGKYSMVRQYGANRKILSDYFQGPAEHKVGGDIALAVTRLPAEYKALPSVQSSKSYLRGFIAGLIAADGSVDDTGRVIITQANYEKLQGVRELAMYAGLPTLKIQQSSSPGQLNTFFCNQKQRVRQIERKLPMYYLSFVKGAFYTEHGFDERLILKQKHQFRIRNSKGKSIRKRWSMRVIDVKPTFRVEEVFCCIEPETHSFVIDNHYLTGNCFGINPSLLAAGSTSQPYASSALQAEFLNQILRTYQKTLQDHYMERAMVVAEAQGHYEYELRGQTRVPIMEYVREYDDDGNSRIVEKHKLTAPKLKFQSLDLRDEATERQFLQTLRAMGVPIPDNKLMVGINYDIDDMARDYNDELVKKTVAQQEAKLKTYKVLQARGLPMPPDLKAEVEGVPTGGMPGGQPGQGGAGPGGPGGGGGAGGIPSGIGPHMAPGGDHLIMPPPPGMLGPNGMGQGVPGGGPPPAGAGPQGGLAGGANAPAVSMERRPGLIVPTSATEHKATSIDSVDFEEKPNKQEQLPENNFSKSLDNEVGKPETSSEFKPRKKTTKYTLIDEDAE